MKLVIDSITYTDLAQGVTETVEFMAAHGQRIYLPSVVLGELYYGFMKGRRQRFNENRLHQFIEALGVEIIEVNASVARRYGSIFLSLQKRGTRIPINDIWVAACCMEVGGVLLTRDRHFDAVKQIEVVVLPQGE